MPALNERDQGLQDVVMAYLATYAREPRGNYEDALGVIFATAASMALTHFQETYGLSRPEARRLIDEVYATQGPFLDAVDMDRKPETN